MVLYGFATWNGGKYYDNSSYIIIRSDGIWLDLVSMSQWLDSHSFGADCGNRGYGGHDCSIHIICLAHRLCHQPHCWKLRSLNHPRSSFQDLTSWSGDTMPWLAITEVMGPGGYSFLDFLRLGGCLDLVWLVGCSLLLPFMWPMVWAEQCGSDVYIARSLPRSPGKRVLSQSDLHGSSNSADWLWPQRCGSMSINTTFC